MASTSYMYVFVLALLSITSNEMCYASRNLLQASPTLPQPQIPTIPTLPQPQIPTIPTLPQPQMPTIPSLPQPQIPTIPTLPNMPKVSLPPLPSMPTMPTFPNLPTTLPNIPFFAPPPSKKWASTYGIGGYFTWAGYFHDVCSTSIQKAQELTLNVISDVFDFYAKNSSEL
ncbi:hypothetical protein OSB04_007903 [Centaurea solstitialis]|uniref:Uncharacterized protein n=1 Tax=Centaurea solstitialis TaxID=347529 RepID=A0AA38TTA3_9ASTR|nr:hypothetical protein OSB04_007903 [Centaurea solstitialis]